MEKTMIRCADLTVSEEQEDLYVEIGKFLTRLNKPQDAAEANREVPGCAPLHLNTGRLSRQRFSAVWDNSTIAATPAQIVAEFYRSAGYLKKLYGIKTSGTRKLPFPRNIAQEHALLKAQLQKKHPDMRLLTACSPYHELALATMKVYDTDRTLYFLEVAPLHEYLQSNGNDHTAKLLLSIFAYLLQVVRLPYFTDTSSFIYQQYETTKVMIETDGEEDNYIAMIQTRYNYILENGKQIQKLIAAPRQLRQFGPRITEAVKSGGVCPSLVRLAKRAYKLYRRFPHQGIHNIISSTDIEGHIDYDHTIPMLEYFAFVWQCRGCPLYENVEEMINYAFNERDDIEEPVAFQCFNEPQATPNHDLDFPAALLDLICDFAYFLNHNL